MSKTKEDIKILEELMVAGGEEYVKVYRQVIDDVKHADNLLTETEEAVCKEVQEGLRRIFYVDVKNLKPEEAIDFLNKVTEIIDVQRVTKFESILRSSADDIKSVKGAEKQLEFMKLVNRRLENEIIRVSSKVRFSEQS